MLLRNGVRAVNACKAQTGGIVGRPVNCVRQISSQSPQNRPDLSLSTLARNADSGRSTRLLWLSSVLAIGVSSTLLLLQSSPLHLEAPQEAEGQAGAFRLDPSTSQPFPLILPTPLTPLSPSCKELTLVGLGVRTVSFLRVKVYVAGLYVDASALKKLSNTAEWKGFDKGWMMDSKDEHSGEKLVAALLDQGVTCAIRIVPVRSTDFGHLRDGFTVRLLGGGWHSLVAFSDQSTPPQRAIQGRAKLARKQSQMSESTDEALSRSLQELKDAFPRASLPKGNALDLIFTPSSWGAGVDLTLEEGGKVLGRVESPRGSAESQFGVARQLMLAYMADKDEISKPFKESVAEGFQQAVRQ